MYIYVHDVSEVGFTLVFTGFLVIKLRYPTPWSSVLLEKLIVSQQVKKVPV
jgi:hypothetical protein